MNLRAFVGLELPPEVRRAYVAASDVVRRTDPRWAGEKWVAADNLHVTTFFIGNVPEEALAELETSLAEQVSDVDEFDLPLASIAAVPGARKARMIWAELADPTQRASELAERVARAAVAFGAMPPDRHYRPHVTLCRARRPRAVEPCAIEAANELIEGSAEAMSVVSATLFSSRLTPRGPVYERLAAWRLRGVDSA